MGFEIYSRILIIGVEIDGDQPNEKRQKLFRFAMAGESATHPLCFSRLRREEKLSNKGKASGVPCLEAVGCGAGG